MAERGIPALSGGVPESLGTLCKGVDPELTVPGQLLSSSLESFWDWLVHISVLGVVQIFMEASEVEGLNPTEYNPRHVIKGLCGQLVWQLLFKIQAYLVQNLFYILANIVRQDLFVQKREQILLVLPSSNGIGHSRIN